MEDKEFKQKYISNPLCDSCIHLYLNNGESGFGCRAFPNEIPLEAQHGHNHHSVLEGQIGDYIYKEATYEELSPFGKHLYELKHKTK